MIKDEVKVSYENGKIIAKHESEHEMSPEKYIELIESLKKGIEDNNKFLNLSQKELDENKARVINTFKEQIAKAKEEIKNYQKRLETWDSEFKKEVNRVKEENELYKKRLVEFKEEEIMPLAKLKAAENEKKLERSKK